MIPCTPRPLTSGERALVARLLELERLARAPYLPLGALKVTGTCECGCGSIELARSTAPNPGAERSRTLANAYGTVQGGHAVGLILWGTDNQVTGLEIYSLALDPPFELPRPESVSGVPASSDRL